MYQEETNKDISITEYHLCRDCRSFMAIPIALEKDTWDLVCLERRPEFNPDGGLSDCSVFEEG